MKSCDIEFAATMSVDSLFQMYGATTTTAKLPTVNSLSGSTTMRLVLVEQSDRYPGKSSMQQIEVTRCIAMENFVHQDRQLELNSFQNQQPVQTDDSTSNVVTGPQVIDQSGHCIQDRLESMHQVGWKDDQQSTYYFHSPSESTFVRLRI